MRMIDADAIVSKLKNKMINPQTVFINTVLLGLMDEAPTVDAVEVVRCKDCTHWYDREGVCLKIYSDGNVNADAWQERKAEDFCSYGERRADNGE